MIKYKEIERGPDGNGEKRRKIKRKQRRDIGRERER